MILQKNTASQKLTVYAYNAITGAAVTGDAANITAYISKDGGNGAATNDTNPSAVTDMAGFYAFDLAQAETNCNNGDLVATSTTANVLIKPVRFSCLTQVDTINTNIAKILGAVGVYYSEGTYTRDGSGNVTSYRYEGYSDSAHSSKVVDITITRTYTDGVLTAKSSADYA